VLTRKFSIFDIFSYLWGFRLTPKTNKQAQLGEFEDIKWGLNPQPSAIPTLNKRLKLELKAKI